jgi:hypothetical protein
MMTRDPIRFLLVLGGCVLALSGFVRAQVIQDPSFTMPGYPTNMNFSPTTTFTVNGWTFGVANPGTGPVGTEKWKSPGGTIDMITNNGSTNGSLFLQTTMTGLVTGQTYSLSFDASRNGAIGNVGVFLNGSTTPTATYALGTSTTTQTITFVATGTSELLRFQDTNPGTGTSDWNLGNITVTAVGPVTPEPNSVVAAALLALGIVGLERRRIRNVMRR